MNQDQILTNAMLVLDDEVVHGSLVIKDGVIKALERGPVSLPGVIDCQGDILMPGMIELHTDNMEKYFQPRPKVSWPGRQAALAHDAQMAASGINHFTCIEVRQVVADGVNTPVLDAHILSGNGAFIDDLRL